MKKILIATPIIIITVLYILFLNSNNQIGELSIKIENELVENTKVISSTLATQFPINNIQEIDEYNLQLFAFHNLENSLTNIITKEEMDKSLTEYLDISSINYQDIICPLDNLVMYEYNESTKLFNYNDQHDHGAVFEILNNKVYLLDSYQEKEKYVIEVHILFGELNTGATEDPSKYYINAENAIKRENILFEITESKSIASNYQDVKNDLPIYKVTFIKDDTNYLLDSIIEK